MKNEKNIRRIKIIVYGLVVSFILIFINGFLSLGGKSLLAFDLLYFVLGVTLLLQIFKSDVEGKLKGLLLLTGFSSLGFSAGIAYGVFGIWGFYSINNPIYLGLTIVSWIGFIIGVIGSFVLLKNEGRQNAASVTG